MARQLSTTVLGKPIDAIWHTAVVVYGKEYYFGGGIQQDRPGRTPYGTPVRVEDFGITHVAKEVFEDFLLEIGPRYTPETYSILSNNCNHFSNEAIQTTEDESGAIIPPAVKPVDPVAGAAVVAQVSEMASKCPDPLGEAKNQVEEQIKLEFAAIMATGATKAGEAAALAMRRVMERHGLRRTATMRG
ncbi:unnamed protein product [Alopecurus aequalis]